LDNGNNHRNGSQIDWTTVHLLKREGGRRCSVVAVIAVTVALATVPKQQQQAFVQRDTTPLAMADHSQSVIIVRGRELPSLRFDFDFVVLVAVASLLQEYANKTQIERSFQY
jgi:hypothetical protein